MIKNLNIVHLEELREALKILEPARTAPIRSVGASQTYSRSNAPKMLTPNFSLYPDCKAKTYSVEGSQFRDNEKTQIVAFKRNSVISITQPEIAKTYVSNYKDIKINGSKFKEKPNTPYTFRRQTKTIHNMSSLPVLSNKKISLKGNKAFNNIVTDFIKGQKETKRSMKQLKNIKSIIKIHIKKVGNILTRRTKAEKKELRAYVQFVKEHKPLFIYGPTGAGRYINGKAIDPLKLRDTIATANAKCSFLKPRLQDFYKSSKGII